MNTCTHYQEEGCIGLCIPDNQYISRDPRNVPREIFRSEGMYIVQPNTSQLKAVFGHSLINSPSLGMYQDVHVVTFQNDQWLSFGMVFEFSANF